MVRIDSLYSLLNLLRRITNVLGLTVAFSYDGSNFRLEHKRGTPRRGYATLILVINIVASIIYIVKRLSVEQQNYKFNRLEPGSRRALDQHAVFCDILGALVYGTICVKFHAHGRIIEKQLNEMHKTTRGIQKIVKECLDCPFVVVVIAFVLLFQCFLRQLCYLIVDIPLDEDLWLEWRTSSCLFICDIFVKFHFIAFFLYLVLYSRIYYGLNKFLELRMSKRRLKTLKKCLLLQSSMQQWHSGAVKYFAFYFGWLQLNLLNSSYNFATAFKFIDETMTSQRGEDHPSFAGFILPEMYISEAVQNGLTPIWSAAQILLLLYTANVCYREKMLFRMQLLDLTHNPGASTTDAYETSPHEVNPIDDTQRSRTPQAISKCGIVDLMLENNINLIDFADENVISLRAFGMELPLRALIWRYTLLISCGVLMIVVMICHRKELIILENMSKE